MALAVQPFSEALLPAAAALVAARVRHCRQHTPALPAIFAEASSHLALLEAELHAANGIGVAAVDGEGLAGFLLASMPLPAPQSFLGIYFPSHFGRVSLSGWGARPGDEFNTIRVLYAALAPALIARGALHHVVNVGADEQAAQTAWRSLGFGRRLATGLRDTAPAPARPPDGFTIRRATPDDLPALVQMVSDNDRHHATPPIFEPFMPETPLVHREVLARLLADPACSGWLAVDADGRCLGINTYSVAEPAMGTPEGAVYLEDGYTAPEARGLGVGAALLARGLDWARSAGKPWCTISWNTDNLLGARFWQSHGFRPVSFRLRRSVDQRIAWSSGLGRS